MFSGMGISTGVDLDAVLDVADAFAAAVGHEAASRYLKAERATAKRRAAEASGT